MYRIFVCLFELSYSNNQYCYQVPETQIHGFVMIVDWTEFTFKQSTKLSPKMLKMIVEGLQVSFGQLLLDCSLSWVLNLVWSKTIDTLVERDTSRH